jgi:hypothetical protein
MISGLPFKSETCRVCADICEACAESCDQFEGNAEMKICATGCRKCTESCRWLSGGVRKAPYAAGMRIARTYFMNRSFSILLLTALLQASCGGTSSSQTPSPPPNGSGGSRPGEVPGGNGSDVVIWTELHEELGNDAVSPQDCQYPWKFTVQNNGQYEAGPCVQGGQLVTGSIRQDELAILSAKAQAVASSDLSTPQCEPFGAIASSFLDLMTSSNTTWRIKDANPRSLCFRGDLAQARDLASTFEALIRKYYPKRSSQ